ncbi:MAG: hypothetical protein ABSB95_01030 [Dissulfurispiraceae bacterium]|jgi:hypothetical protein
MFDFDIPSLVGNEVFDDEYLRSLYSDKFSKTYKQIREAIETEEGINHLATLLLLNCKKVNLNIFVARYSALKDFINERIERPDFLATILADFIFMALVSNYTGRNYEEIVQINIMTKKAEEDLSE